MPRSLIQPREYRVIALRECPTPEQMQHCETSQQAVAYWRRHIATHPHFDPERECFAVLLLNTRRRIKGHQLLTIGLVDSVFVHPREVFRAAIIASAASVVAMHNHPSGEPDPSDTDIRITRNLVRAGELLQITLLDHVIVGNPNHCSLRTLGYVA